MALFWFYTLYEYESVCCKDGKPKSKWLTPREDILAELTEMFKENTIWALLSLEVHEVIRAPSAYFSMNSL